MKKALIAALVAVFVVASAQAAGQYTRIATGGIVCNTFGNGWQCQREDANLDQMSRDALSHQIGIYFSHTAVAVYYLNPNKPLLARGQYSDSMAVVPPSTDHKVFYFGTYCSVNAQIKGIVCGLVNNQGYTFSFTRHRLFIKNTKNGATVFNRNVP